MLALMPREVTKVAPASAGAELPRRFWAKPGVREAKGGSQRPTHHDVGEMLQAGDEVRSWVDAGLHSEFAGDASA